MYIVHMPNQLIRGVVSGNPPTSWTSVGPPTARPEVICADLVTLIHQEAVELGDDRRLANEGP